MQQAATAHQPATPAATPAATQQSAMPVAGPATVLQPTCIEVQRPDLLALWNKADFMPLGFPQLQDVPVQEPVQEPVHPQQAVFTDAPLVQEGQGQAASSTTPWYATSCVTQTDMLRKYILGMHRPGSSGNEETKPPSN